MLTIIVIQIIRDSSKPTESNSFFNDCMYIMSSFTNLVALLCAIALDIMFIPIYILIMVLALVMRLFKKRTL